MDFGILNVLVVDDELPIRQEFELLPWHEYNCIHIGSAKNGEEALAFCRSFCPDIVITDITMPVMDGIQLIKHLQEEFPKIKVIILTCHKDFSYAKEALSLGVVDYLIKLDLSKDAISKVIQKAKDLIDIDNLANSSIKDMQRTVLSEIFSKQAKLPKTQRTLEEELAKLDFSVEFSCSCFLLMDVASNQIFLENETRKFLNSSDSIEHWFLLNNSFYCLLLQDLREEAILAFLNSLKQHLDSHLFLQSMKVAPFAILPKKKLQAADYLTYVAHEQAYRDYHFYQHQIQLLPMDELPVFQEVTLERKQSFYSLLEKDDGILDLAPLKAWAMETLLFPNQLKQLAASWLQDSQLLPKTIHVQKTWNANDIDEFVESFQHEINRPAQNQLRYEIRMAIEIVEKEYMNPISLSYVADKVNLSPQHLSKIFSKDVGGTFNDYITRVRMENAQRLINESNLKIYEIAEQVGIPNYRYFSTLYKKWTGDSPTSIKKKVF